jgi:hypothetical protein
MPGAICASLREDFHLVVQRNIYRRQDEEACELSQENIDQRDDATQQRRAFVIADIGSIDQHGTHTERGREKRAAQSVKYKLHQQNCGTAIACGLSW